MGTLVFAALGVWASARLSDGHPTLAAVAFIAAAAILVGGIVGLLVAAPLVGIASLIDRKDRGAAEGVGAVVGIVFGLIDTVATVAVVVLLIYSFVAA